MTSLVVTISHSPKHLMKAQGTMSVNTRQQHFKLLVDRWITAELNSASIACRGPLERLISTVRSSSKLLSHQHSPAADAKSTQRLLRAFTQLAERAPAWIRCPEDWLGVGGSLAVQFQSLVSHLLDAYPVPKFMARVWLADDLDRHAWQLDLYQHLAAGLSVRKFPWPHGMSRQLDKKTAAWFMQAPDELAPMTALRWAQARALGSEPPLARSLATCEILRAPTIDEPFWSSVLRFIVRNQPISIAEALSIVEFVNAQKFMPARRVLRDLNWEGSDGTNPLQPQLTLEGRSLRSLRRHMANWLVELSARVELPPQRTFQDWPASGLVPIQLQMDGCTWVVEELRNQTSLRIEGGIMKHCVASYAHACRHRYSSIWSMKAIANGKRRRVLTIEVSPSTRRIVQAKAAYNRPPSPKAEQVLKAWAASAGLLYLEC